MPTIKQINSIIEEASSLKMITQSYSEIAAIKLQKIRAGIERNRIFFEEVSEIYKTIKIVARKKGINPDIHKKGSISVLLTSNDRFYGGLENELIKYFIINTAKYKTGRMIIGRTALNFFEGMDYFHTFEILSLKQDVPTQEELRNLNHNLSQYEKIYIYYPTFQSVLVQTPRVTDITQSSVTKEETQLPVDYIFEPEIEEMLQFFTSQITIMLLEQTFLESELARTAARLISMDEAQSNADDYIKQQKRTLSKAKRNMNNMQLLETIATLINWRTSQSA